MIFKIAPHRRAVSRLPAHCFLTWSRFFGLTLAFVCEFAIHSSCSAQIISITRTASDPLASVLLVSLMDGSEYPPSVSQTDFIIPSGPYLVQLRNGSGNVLYTEFEYLDKEAKASRVIGIPGYRHVGLGVNVGGVHTECIALIEAAKLVTERYGITPERITQRFSTGQDIVSSISGCQAALEQGFTDALATTFEDPDAGDVTVSIRKKTGSLFDVKELLSNKTGYIKEGIIHVLALGTKALVQCGVSDYETLEFCYHDDSTVRKPEEALVGSNDYSTRKIFSVYTVSATVNKEGPADRARNDKLLGKKLYGEMVAIEKDTRTRIDRLKTFSFDEKVSQLRFQSDKALYYKTSEVSSIFQVTNKQVAQSMTYLGLIGLKDYYSDKVANLAIPADPYFKTQSAQDLLSKLIALLSRMKRVSTDLSVTLWFSTIPLEATGARLTVNIEQNNPSTLFSQNGTHRIYRGLYPYTVSKRGYQSYSGKLDLIDDPGSHVVCHLMIEGENQDETWCSQQEN